jgi:amino acid permease
MGLSRLFPWKKAESSKKGPKTINIFVGFFFIVNYCLGVGFLGIPYAFFYSGYTAAIPALLFVSIISWINANYLLEVMARAQVRVYQLT